VSHYCTFTWIAEGKQVWLSCLFCSHSAMLAISSLFVEILHFSCHTCVWRPIGADVIGVVSPSLYGVRKLDSEINYTCSIDWMRNVYVILTELGLVSYRRTDRHTATAYAALASSHAVKTNTHVIILYEHKTCITTSATHTFPVSH